MARIRTVKPEFWKDEDLSSLPSETHMMAAALLNHSDDEGFFRANPMLVKAECCPLREDSVSVHDMLKQLSEIGYIRLFEGSDGKQYGEVINFTKHQKVNRPTASKIKGLSVISENSVSDHGGLTPGKERKGKESNSPCSPPGDKPTKPESKKAPTKKQTRLPADWAPSEANLSFAAERNVDGAREAEKFKNHWQSKGTKRLDWDATWRNWILRAVEMGAKPANDTPDTKGAEQTFLDHYRKTGEWLGEGDPPADEDPLAIPKFLKRTGT